MATNTPLTVKIELDAGNASMVDLGKALGPHGVSTIALKKQYDAETARQAGEIVPVVVIIRDDRSFQLVYKTPPTAFLIKQALRVKGSSRPGHEPAGVLTVDQLASIAARKLPDLNTGDLEVAMRQIEGTARSMGVRVQR